jgi:hypothetical protein
VLEFCSTAPQVLVEPLTMSRRPGGADDAPGAGS